MVRRRLILLAAILSIPFAALLARLYSLQLCASRHEDCLRRSRQARVEILPPRRGRILAADGRTVLAKDRPAYSVRFQYYSRHGEPPSSALNPRAKDLDRIVEILQQDAQKSQSTFPDRDVVEATLVEAGRLWCEDHDPASFTPEDRKGEWWKPLVRRIPPDTGAKLESALGKKNPRFQVLGPDQLPPEAQGTSEVWFCVPTALQMELTLERLVRVFASPGEAASLYEEFRAKVASEARRMETAAEAETRAHLAGLLAEPGEFREVFGALKEKETVRNALKGLKDLDEAVDADLHACGARHPDASARKVRQKFSNALWFRYAIERPILRSDVPEHVVTAIEYHKDLFRGLEISVSSRRRYWGDQEGEKKTEAFAPLLGRLKRVTGDDLGSLARRETLETKAREGTLGLGRNPEEPDEATELESLRSGDLSAYRRLRIPDSSPSEDEFLELREGALLEDEYLGAQGLEQIYDRALRGKHGVRIVSLDAHLDASEVVLAVPPEHGADVRTTIDAALQEALYESLVQSIQLDKVQGLGGSAVVMDVLTGAILAAVGAPSVDPGQWYADEAYRKAVKDAWPRPTKHAEDYLFHRPFDLSIDPGSVFKLFVAVAALQAATPWEGPFSPTRRYLCTHTRFPLSPNIRKDCDHNHGEIDLVDAIGGSCNHYFFYVGWKHLGEGPLWSWARAFGFGEMPPGDLPMARGFGGGWLENPVLGKSRDAPPDGNEFDLAIGQRLVKATPLQVVIAVAAIARGDGLLPTPHLVVPHAPRKIVVPDPETRRPAQSGLRNPAETLDLVREGMWRAGHAAGGTVYRRTEDTETRDLCDFDAAYKTGTAETGIERSKDCKEYHGWLVGFAPFKKPRIAFAVAIERTILPSGGQACAPVVRRILEYYAEKSPREYVLAERDRKTEVSVRTPGR